MYMIASRQLASAMWSVLQHNGDLTEVRAITRPGIAPGKITLFDKTQC